MSIVVQIFFFSENWLWCNNTAQYQSCYTLIIWLKHWYSRKYLWNCCLQILAILKGSCLPLTLDGQQRCTASRDHQRPVLFRIGPRLYECWIVLCGETEKLWHSTKSHPRFFLWLMSLSTRYLLRIYIYCRMSEWVSEWISYGSTDAPAINTYSHMCSSCRWNLCLAFCFSMISRLPQTSFALLS